MNRPLADLTQSDDTCLLEWLRPVRTIAVVGLSPRPERDSHQVARVLVQLGYHVVPVNPTVSEIMGQRCFASLEQAAVLHRIDLVDAFRRSEDMPDVARQAVAIGARGLWMQLGVTHPAAAQQARDAGLWVVEDRCLKIDLLRLGLRAAAP